MVERKITSLEVQDCINLPDYVITKDGKTESHKKIGDKLLKVVYVKEDKLIKIITLMWR